MDGRSLGGESGITVDALPHLRHLESTRSSDELDRELVSQAQHIERVRSIMEHGTPEIHEGNEFQQK